MQCYEGKSVVVQKSYQQSGFDSNSSVKNIRFYSLQVHIVYVEKTGTWENFMFEIKPEQGDCEIHFLKTSSRFEPSTIHLFQKGGMLSECYKLVSTSADDWFTKGHP